MTKEELRKGLKLELRRNGFRAYRTLWARNVEEEVVNVASFYLHRFRPQLLVDLGVLLRERWSDPTGPEARSTSIAWDISARLDTLLKADGSPAQLRRASAFDLEIDLNDDARLQLIAEGVTESGRIFFDKFNTKQDFFALARVHQPDNVLWLSDRLYEHLGLPIP